MSPAGQDRVTRLSLEPLEARECPALTISYFNNALVVRGSPTLPYVAPPDGLNFSLTASNLIRIREVGYGGATAIHLGDFRPTRTLLLALNHTDTDINFDLNNRTLPSNLVINLGKGDIDPFPLANFVSIHQGTVSGNLTILGGSGAEQIQLGRSSTFNVEPVRIRGSVTMAASPRQDPVGFGGDLLSLFAGSEVRGNLATSEVDNLEIGEAVGAVARVAGRVTMNVARSRNPGRMNVYGDVGRDVVYQGSNALDSFITDSVIVQGDNPTPALIRGNLIAHFGFGDSDLIVEDGATVRGNLWATANGPGSAGAIPPAPFFSRFILGGTVHGSAALDAGNGASRLIVPTTGTVYGTFTFRAGNGDNDLRVDGVLNASASITLGNGDNTATFTRPPAVALYWTSGNGDNEITLGSADTPADMIWHVQMRLGTGDDTLTLDPDAPPGQYLTGAIRNAGVYPGDDFNQAANWTLLPTLVLSNFP